VTTTAYPTPLSGAAGTPGRAYVTDENSAEWAVPVWMQVMYGTGIDGDVTLDGVSTPSWATRSGSTYTLTRDVDARVLTFTGVGTTLKPGDFRLRCWKGVGEIDHFINDNGNDASGTTAGAALTATGTLRRGATAGAVGKSSAGTGTNAGNNTAVGYAARGGAGGAVGGTAGGTSGTVASVAATSGIATNGVYMLTGWLGTASGPTAQALGGGSGGGGGAVGASGTSGAGGGGGGRCLVWMLECDFAGTISADGGAGSNASAGDAGGGGGGGGGEAVLYTEALVRTPTVRANGGTGGAGFGTGSSGVAGTAGRALIVSPGA
jgi:hypothetical protein